MRRFAAMTAPHWLLLYGGIVAAWAGLALLAVPAAPDLWGRLAALCLGDAREVGGAPLLAMWALMAAAMMLPTALPALATHDEIATANGTGGQGALAAGYLAVWLGFAVAAAGAQAGLARMLGAPTLGGPAAAGLLICAAAYQVSPLKRACLARCRQPLTFFFQHWDEGPWRMGLRLGAVCLGCCWALMALALIGGAMSLGLMALATLLMLAEKLDASERVSRAIALACLTAAGYLIGDPAWIA
jgi:predicted metal-binding membrane protein